MALIIAALRSQAMGIGVAGGTQISPPDPSEAVTITKWQILSSAVWSDEGPEDPLYVTPSALDSSNDHSPAAVATADAGWLNIARHVPLKAGVTRGVATVSFEIAKATQPLFLSVASADGVSISVNGVPLLSSWQRDDYKARLATVRHPLRFNEVCAILPSDGNSNVVITVPNRREFWLLRATLASAPDVLLKTCAYKAGFSFLKSHLLEDGEQPELDLGVSQAARIVGVRELETSSDLVRIVKVRAADTEFYEPVLVQGVDRIRKATEAAAVPGGADLTAYAERVRILVGALPSQAFKDGIYRKIARTLACMDRVIPELIHESVSLRHFRSQIDGASQYYMVSRPPNENGDYIVYMPFVQYPAREFLGSWFVAASELTEQFADCARENGYGVIFPYCRGNSYGNPIGESDLDEVISDIRSRGVVRSLSLYGECSSGMSAIMAAEKAPGVRCLAVANPIGERLASHWPLAPGGVPSSRLWLHSSDLFTNAPRLRNKHLLIMHDDGIPHSPPYQVSSSIAEHAKKQGATAEIFRLTKWTADAVGRFRIACRWFASTDVVRRNESETQLRFSHEVDIGKKALLQGPILQAFSRPFLVAYEKGDEPFARTVVNGWMERKFTVPRMKEAGDITNEDCATFNVVSILPAGAKGSEACEAIKSKLVARYGEKVGIIIFCQPALDDRYNVYIVRNGDNRETFPSIDLSLDGTWDYMVFGAGSNEFLGGGFFAADWSHDDI